MPIYTFRCDECNFEFEHIMTIKEGENLTGKTVGDCPSCHKKDSIRKVPSAGSFVINGYCEATGYATKRTHK